MSLTDDDLLLVLELFAASDWDDLDLTSGGMRLAVSKRAGSVVPAPAVPPPAPVAGDDEPPAGVVALRSPTLGTFFVAPKPGAPPFVQPGDVVSAGDTVAIVEVMKLMNPVKAEVTAEVLRVCARNNELVEYDRVLFWLKPVEGAA